MTLLDPSLRPIELREVATSGGLKLGFARLNAERSLNALSLAMIRPLDAQLRAWAADDALVCVVLEGAGTKAFCAGGDVRAIYRSILEYPSDPLNPEALAFFSEEYRLDFRIHRYPKPILVWGSGIVMGGGLGLLAGASHRVVTETSRIAMPEITIGLFPDVGGSWFLRRMPGRLGLFAALTGAPLNGRDALHAGLANHLLPAGERESVSESLKRAPWQEAPAENHALLTRLLDNHTAARDAAPEGKAERNAAKIDTLCEGDSLQAVISRIDRSGDGDPWIAHGAATLRAGSPTTAALIWELWRRAEGLALADVLRMELTVAMQCCAHHDFAEGVRALLIDKDNRPRWSPATLAELTTETIARHFAEPSWPLGVSPLADL